MGSMLPRLGLVEKSETGERGSTRVATLTPAKVLRRRIPLALPVILVPNFVGREAGTNQGRTSRMTVVGVVLGGVAVFAAIFLLTARASIREKPRYSWQVPVEPTAQSLWTRLTRWALGG